MTTREMISKLRKRIQEKDADSTFTNKFLYSSLKEHAKWLIKREISAGRIFRSKDLFQTRPCLPVVRASKIDDCCPIVTNCVVYRTRYKLDNAWEDEYGPLISRVTSIDGSTEISVVSPRDYMRKKENPYFKFDRSFYAIYENGYIWFEDNAPKKINVTYFPEEDIVGKYGCKKNCCDNACVSALDKKFMLPSWVEAELLDKLVTQLLGTTKRIPEDTSIDKNTNRDT